eukprot:g3142.t1
MEVLFFAPYCEHSKKFAPVYSSLSQSFAEIALFGAVDCSESINQDLCRQFEIKSFPTLKVHLLELIPLTPLQFFPPGTKKADNQAARKYEGPRTIVGITEVIRELITDQFIHGISTLEGLVSDQAYVVLFTKKEKPTLLYKSLSWRYHEHAKFYEIKTTDPTILDQFEVTQFPTLITTKDGHKTRYSGDLNAPSLVVFFDKIFNIHYEEELDLHLRVLSSSDFKQIDVDEEIWLVGFFADPDGNGCVDELIKFQTEVTRIEEYCRVGIFNISSDLIDLKSFEIKQSKLESNPCRLKIVRFPFGVDKSEQDEYEVYSGKMEASSLQAFVHEAISDNPVKLHEQNMHTFLNSDVPKPKVILFSSFETCPKLFSALAMSLRHWKADFGFIPMSEIKIRSQFEINKIPSLMLVFIDPNAEEGRQVFAPKYQGPLQFGPMKGWIEALLFTLKITKEDHNDPFFEAHHGDYVPRIEKESDVGQFCNSSVPLCAFVVLDSISEKFQSQLDWLGTFIVQKVNAPISFAWLDYHQGEIFIREFGVGIGDVPSIVVYSPKHHSYTVLKRKLNSQEVEDFFYKVIHREEPMYPMSTLPQWSPENEEEVQIIEDEIDLDEMKTYYCQTSIHFRPLLYVTGSRKIRLPPRYAASLENTVPALSPLTDCTGYEETHAFSKFSNWVIPGQLMVGRYPYIEPGSQRRCNTHEKGIKQIEQIMDAQIETFVCLQEELPPQKEMNDTGSMGFLPYHTWCEEFADSVEFLHFPIEDLSVPDKEALGCLLEDLNERLSSGEKMYIHCWGGRGRAGLVASCLLAKSFEISAEEALERIGRAFSTRKDSTYRSPETEEQVQFVKDFIASYC